MSAGVCSKGDCSTLGKAQVNVKFLGLSYVLSRLGFGPLRLPLIDVVTVDPVLAILPLFLLDARLAFLAAVAHFYLLQPFLVSSNPSNKRPALAPASVSIRCGWPFSTV
jgi:hypothetical protein